MTSSLAEGGYYDATCRPTQRKIHLHNINGLRWADKALNRMTRGPILEEVMFRFHGLSALYDFVVSDSTPLAEVRRIEVCLESWEAVAIFSIPELVSEHATDSRLVLMVRGALAGRNTSLQELVINSDKFRQIVTTHLVSIGLV